MCGWGYAYIDIGFLGPSGLLDLKSLSKQLREVIILRTCISTRNHYEFNLHVQTISLIMGVSSEQIEDLKQERINTSLWSSELCAVVSLVDELVTCLDVSDNTFYKLRNYFDDAQLIEIVQLVGIYTGVAMLVALIRPKLDNYR
ncbi:carboxymuconolactone decarboxylase family protein [Rheinheimera baltica]|uniref:carboxymuconolactone decarboxylase family protein n=1 Tax=Rheinheimera baltica TaxID=67576 RepID=UPI000566F90C|nr:carboxymuconolactone decarboxylase family protein [Rheinheimera baltica]